MTCTCPPNISIFFEGKSSSKSHKFSSKKLCSGFRINVALTSTICKPELVRLPLTTKYLRELSKLFEQIFSYAIFSKTSQDLAIQPKKWQLMFQLELFSVSHNFLKSQVKGPMIKANIQLANLRFMTAIESYGRGVFWADDVPRQCYLDL